MASLENNRSDDAVFGYITNIRMSLREILISKQSVISASSTAKQSPFPKGKAMTDCHASARNDRKFSFSPFTITFETEP